MSKLVNNSGEIQIPGIKELVAPLTDEERSRYEAINVTVKDFDDAVGAAITLHEDKVNTVSLEFWEQQCESWALMGLWLGVLVDGPNE